MGYKLVGFETSVNAYQDSAYRKEPGWLNAVRRDAGRTLADMIMNEASLYQRIDGDPNDLLSKTVHRWEVGIQVDRAELEARKEQMAEAERKGMERAASLVREAAARFQTTDGHCKWVIMDALRSAAKEIDEAAQS